MDNSDLIGRKALLKEIRQHGNLIPTDAGVMEFEMTYSPGVRLCMWDVEHAPAAQITGETSDGYHTFNELYHHRAVLFSVIVKAFPDRAWKSRQHHDGSMYDGMFIVGIDTPDGPATYHYDLDPYWDMFHCREMERAPEWDGHTPAQAIERIGKLEPRPMLHGMWSEVRNPEDGRLMYLTVAFCGNCKIDMVVGQFDNYCPRCGAQKHTPSVLTRDCSTCENYGWDMPQCKDCGSRNGFKWHKAKAKED